jgi:hypothetical protein
MLLAISTTIANPFATTYLLNVKSWKRSVKEKEIKMRTCELNG